MSEFITIRIPEWGFWTIIAIWAVHLGLNYALARVNRQLTEAHKANESLLKQLIDRLVALVRGQRDPVLEQEK